MCGHSTVDRRPTVTLEILFATPGNDIAPSRAGVSRPERFAASSTVRRNRDSGVRRHLRLGNWGTLGVLRGAKIPARSGRAGIVRRGQGEGTAVASTVDVRGGAFRIWLAEWLI
ncbi:hypothetical protein GCM10009565_75080 [Amycolatopsis albidoflavus]